MFPSLSIALPLANTKFVHVHNTTFEVFLWCMERGGEKYMYVFLLLAKKFNRKKYMHHILLHCKGTHF